MIPGRVNPTKLFFFANEEFFRFSLVSQRGVLALVVIRARIGFHGFPTDIVGGGFSGGMHGSKLTLLILDFLLQLLERRAGLADRLGTSLRGPLGSARLLLAVSTSLKVKTKTIRVLLDTGSSGDLLFMQLSQQTFQIWPPIFRARQGDKKVGGPWPRAT